MSLASLHGTKEDEQTAPSKSSIDASSTLGPLPDSNQTETGAEPRRRIRRQECNIYVVTDSRKFAADISLQ
jgi:hypothetical protein